jgi:SAM-dependent methyltransferase
VDAAGVRALLEQADAAILPSRFDNSPLVVLEALSTGVPVITGERVGIANWVEPENGLLALPTDDPHAFAEHAGQAIADPEWVAAAGPRAAARVREIFDPEVVVPRLLDCYERLLGGEPFKPAAPGRAPAEPTGIQGAKARAILAFADELSADDELLGAFTSAFTADDPVTLVIYAPDNTEAEVTDRLGPALARSGADQPGAADMLALAVPASAEVEKTIATGVHGVLTRRTLDTPYAQLRTFDGSASLRGVLPRAERRPAQISPELRAFVDECAPERQTILDFLIRTSDELEPGARVLDVGAGEQPYRELFPHVEYVTTDWANSVHPGARQVDIVAPADDLPIDDASFDAVINTQVLEHVPEPRKVISEFFRVLKPGGRLYITLPLAWELHEEPWDFYRYTSHGIRHLLESAGFVDVDPRARNDCFTTLAQLMRNTNHVMGRARDGLDAQRDQAAEAMRQMADVVQGFAPLDVRHILPLGYSTTATRPR